MSINKAVNVLLAALVAIAFSLAAVGVLKEGAYADLILVDGNPLENLQLVADPDKNFELIMKDGKVYKNTLQ